MRSKLSEIAAMCGGKLTGEGDRVITGFSTDSRECRQGLMFVPIRGEKTDGHSYINKAFENGAPAAFSDHEIEDAGGPLVIVSDCRAALQKTAAKYREGFSIPIVGITGSVGKTTMKEMAAQALSAKFSVHKTAGNHNSQVGVPITVCGIKKDNTAAVIEMGVSMPGEMARIAAVVKPTCAVMTNIGVSHIEFMKSRENILREKSHIADFLPPDGALFINGDDDLLPELEKTCRHRVISCGLSPRCDWRALELNEADKGTFFSCAGPENERAQAFVPAMGEHNVRNALMSIALARFLGVETEDAVRAIAAYKSPAMRQQISEVGGVVLIDDSYNASPDSMKSALDVLSGRKISGKRVAVLADMLELGDFSRQAHFEVGTYARAKHIDELIAIGEEAKGIAAGFGEEAKWFSDNPAAAEYLLSMLSPGDAVLVKGSRGMKTEEIAQRIRESFSEQKA